MNFNFELSEEAESDLDDAFLWYESQSFGLGEKFIAFVNLGFEFIEKNPEAASYIFEGIVRRHIIDKFPFGIFYILNGQDKKVDVIAVLHFKRGDNIWKGRI